MNDTLIHPQSAHTLTDKSKRRRHAGQTLNFLMSVCLIILGGDLFVKFSFFQAFSDVMVIIDEVSTLQSGQFANSGPHPAILLLTHPIEK